MQKNAAAAKKAAQESLRMTLLQVQQGNELLLDAQLVCQAAFGAQRSSVHQICIWESLTADTGE